MKRLEFDCDYELADEIETLFEDICDDYPLISVYGKYEIIKPLLEDLIMNGFSIANEIQLEDREVSNYDKEFVLYVNPDGIDVEKTFVDGEYFYGCGDISFVHEDCSSTLLKYIESDKIYEFGYSDEHDECDDCDDKCDCDCENRNVDNKPVSTASKETFKVNGKCVDRDTFEKELEKFEDKYMDNIKDMLLRYADFMDDWNEWLKLLY